MKTFGVMILLTVVSLLAVSLVSAVPARVNCTALGYDRTQPAGGVGDPDNECQNAGFSFGIAKYGCGDSVVEDGSLASYYDINVSFFNDCESASWTASPAIEGVVLSKEGVCYQDLPGGSNGNITKIRYGISHITFCGNNPPVVPEFGLIAGITAVVGALGLFFIVRRR